MAIPRIFREVRKTGGRPSQRLEKLGDCHDQPSDWSRNDSPNERSDTNFWIPLFLMTPQECFFRMPTNTVHELFVICSYIGYSSDIILG